MTHAQRLGRAGALASLVLAAGVSFTIPTFAQPLSDAPTTATGPDPTQTDTLETAPPMATDGVAPTTVTPAEDATVTETDPGTAAPSEIPSDTPTPTATTEASDTSSPSPPANTSSPTADPDPTASETSIPSATATAEDAPPPSEPSPTTSETPFESPTATPTDAELTTPTSTSTATTEGTPSVTPTPSATPTLELARLFAVSVSYDPGTVLINEVAWSGTEASANDEWIELWNTSPDPIGLEGWRLTDDGDIDVELSGEIAAFGFYLLERTDDSSVSDIAADRIYTGSLSNAGEALELRDPSGVLIDTANDSGGAWPAGEVSPRLSMERHGLLDGPSSWSTFPGLGGNGLDADGNPIGGTPRRSNAPSTPLASATPSPTPTSLDDGSPGTSYPEGAILINEVAWAGTRASSSDEWIELYNPGQDPIDLEGWRLTDDGDINVGLAGSLAPGAYALLERSDDSSVSDIAADRIYTGSLSNGGERLRLLDPTGSEVDVVNPGGGPWPAGDAASKASMERGAGRWQAFNGYYGRGLDADGQPIRGTPGGPNSLLFPTPTPTWIPGRVVINELLIRPRYDWEGAGGVTTDDEFIELYNRGPGAVNLRDWILDDYVAGGSSPYTLPAMTLRPHSFAVFFRSHTHIALNDSGDAVRLSAPDGSLVDKIRYLRVRAANLSYGRLPDGDDVLVYGLWPTPGKENELFRPPGPFPAGTIILNEVAWAGTPASSSDEWVELWNPGARAVNLFGWTLTDDGDITVHLIGVVEPEGYYLLERSSDQAVSDIPADRIYSGSLSNGGERLRLLDPTGSEIDVVDPGGGPWPAGDAATASMERDGDAWTTFEAGFGRGHDADGNPIRGTPGGPNSGLASAELVTCEGTGQHPMSGPCP